MRQSTFTFGCEYGGRTSYKIAYENVLCDYQGEVLPACLLFNV